MGCELGMDCLRRVRLGGLLSSRLEDSSTRCCLVADIMAFQSLPSRVPIGSRGRLIDASNYIKAFTYDE